MVNRTLIFKTQFSQKDKSINKKIVLGRFSTRHLAATPHTTCPPACHRFVYSPPHLELNHTIEAIHTAPISQPKRLIPSNPFSTQSLSYFVSLISHHQINHSDDLIPTVSLSPDLAHRMTPSSKPPLNPTHPTPIAPTTNQDMTIYRSTLFSVHLRLGCLLESSFRLTQTSVPASYPSIMPHHAGKTPKPAPLEVNLQHTEWVAVSSELHDRSDPLQQAIVATPPDESSFPSSLDARSATTNS